MMIIYLRLEVDAESIRIYSYALWRFELKFITKLSLDISMV